MVFSNVCRQAWENSMTALDSHSISCPYCGEGIDVLIDYSVEQQRYVEDCSVCCQPIILTINIDAQQQVSIDAERENN